MFLSYLLFFLFASLSPKEISLIEKCLTPYSLSRKELAFEKKWAIDSLFLLKRVARSLDEPLWLPFYLDSTVSHLDRFLNKFLSNHNPPVNFSSLPKMINDLSSLTYRFGEELEPLYRWKREGQLSEEERDYLLYFAPTLFSDEEDTTDDYLKGLLHKEFSQPIKFDSAKIPGDSFFSVLRKVHFPEILNQSLAQLKRFSQYLEFISQDFGGRKEKIECPNVSGKVYHYEENEWGKVVIGSEENNFYYGDFSVIIDLGGDDIYYVPNGAIGFFGHPFSAIIDFSGNDFYQSQRPFSLAGSIFGVSLLLDFQGKDIYLGKEYSLGSALFGLGIFLDYEGDDRYEGKTFTQGAGFYGLGFLFDLGGNDVYRSDNFSQGFGSTFGYGLLFDRSGNDLYYAGGRFRHEPLLPNDFRSFAQGFGMGFRPDAGGGIGLLYDGKGNDFYNGDVFSQGTSYWYSLGMLFDGEGNDQYLATEYAQGAGIHLASGILIDKKGNDNYYSRLGPAQGEGHDFSVGILIDKEGDDHYYTSGGQGIGLTNSFGLFLDSEGDDTYLTREKGFGQGWANQSRDFGGVGIFLDLGGEDLYPKDCELSELTYSFKGFYGVGINLREKKKGEVEEEVPVESLTEKSIGEVFKGASEWEVGSAKKRVRAYRRELIKRDTISRNYIFAEKIATRNSLELRAIEEFCESLPEKVIPYLFQYLWDERREARANVIYLLGKLKVKAAVDSLISALKERRLPNGKVIRNRPRWIISALGEIVKADSIITPEDSILRKKVLRVILRYLKDKSEPIRISATVALGKIKEEEALPNLIENLSDPIFTVRQAAEVAIKNYGEKGVDDLLLYLKSSTNPLLLRGLIICLGEQIPNLKEGRKKEVRKILSSFLTSPHLGIRMATVLALSNFKDEYTRNLLKNHYEEETDPIILDKLKSILREE
ncbi:MAG: HEAT repeat domain-containing protein [candidate division WOR-3 bacterium]